MPVPRRPDVHVSFSVDGVGYDITAPTDISVLQAIREFTDRSDLRFRCESGLCGTCEAIMNGSVTRLCSLGSARLDGAIISTTVP